MRIVINCADDEAIDAALSKLDGLYVSFTVDHDEQLILSIDLTDKASDVVWQALT